MRRICVFCGASAGNDPAYTALARSVGEGLARRGIGIVYGGGRVGLMGVVADAALAAGGEVIGVIPRSLVDRELAHPGATEMRIVGTLHERKALMADLSDLLTAVGDTLRTDIPIAALPDLIVTFESVDSDRIARAVIRHPLVRSESTRYGDALVPRLDKIRAMAAELFTEPGTLPAGVESPEPSEAPAE